MKKCIIIMFFIWFCSLNSQNNIVNYSFVKKDSLVKNKDIFNLPKNTIVKSDFSVYNKNTDFNSRYYISKDTIEFIGFIPQNNFGGVKKDSYNPHGTNNIGASVFMGVFNWLAK